MRRLLASIGVLLVAWLVAPAVAPIYDGAGFVDEPYRYVQSPDGKPTKAPTSAHATVAVNTQGLSNTAYSNSDERGPQVVLFIPAGSLQAPAGAKAILLSETPLAPAPPLPTDGTIVTNVYRVAATTSQGDVKVVGKSENQLPTLQMRAPSTKQPGPVFEHRTAAGWQRAATLRVGQDIYQASAPQFGDWALVQLDAKTSTTGTSRSGGGINVGLLVAGVAVLALAGIIMAIRVTRSRKSA